MARVSRVTVFDLFDFAFVILLYILFIPVYNIEF